MNDLRNHDIDIVINHLVAESFKIHRLFNFRRPKDWKNNSKYQQCITYFNQFGINIHNEIFSEGSHGKKNIMISRNKE